VIETFQSVCETSVYYAAPVLTQARAFASPPVLLFVLISLTISCFLISYYRSLALTRAVAAVRESGVDVGSVNESDGTIYQDDRGYFVESNIAGAVYRFRLEEAAVMRFVVSAMIPKDNRQEMPPPNMAGEHEMAVSGSNLRPLTQDPDGMAIIHDAAEGSVDLEGNKWGVINRVKLNGKTYLMTASHVLQGLRHSENVYIRSNGKDYPFPKDYPIHGSSDENDLDIVLVEVPTTFWSGIGLKALPLVRNLARRTVMKVFTPNRYGRWFKSMATPLRAAGAFRFHHGGSTDYGASGGAMLTSRGVAAVHTGRVTSQSCNIATGVGFLFNSKETPVPDHLFNQEEFDNRRNYDDYADSYFISKQDRRHFSYRDGIQHEAPWLDIPDSHPNPQWSPGDDWGDEADDYDAGFYDVENELSLPVKPVIASAVPPTEKPPPLDFCPGTQHASGIKKNLPDTNGLHQKPKPDLTASSNGLEQPIASLLPAQGNLKRKQRRKKRQQFQVSIIGAPQIAVKEVS